MKSLGRRSRTGSHPPTLVIEAKRMNQAAQHHVKGERAKDKILGNCHISEMGRGRGDFEGDQRRSDVRSRR